MSINRPERMTIQLKILWQSSPTFMAKFTAFDQTMDMSAVLSVMCEADPFVTSRAAVDAKTYVLQK